MLVLRNRCPQHLGLVPQRGNHVEGQHVKKSFVFERREILRLVGKIYKDYLLCRQLLGDCQC